LQYFERLVKLEVDSLELCRIRFDLIYVFKLLFGIVNADVPALFAANKVDTVTRGYCLKLFVQHSRIDARKYFFSNRVIQSWNSLPTTPDGFSSLACFRRFLERTDLSRCKVGSN